jgi:hypothetical protein
LTPSKNSIYFAAQNNIVAKYQRCQILEAARLSRFLFEQVFEWSETKTYASKRSPASLEWWDS